MRSSHSNQKLTVSLVAFVAALGMMMAPMWVPFGGSDYGAAWAEGGQPGGKGNQGAGKGGNGGNQGAGNSGQTQAPKGAKRPNWADSEKMVDIGRLNILKANPRVLNHAVYEERLADFTLYTKTYTDFVASLTDLDQIVDSPVANMGILNAYWSEVASGTYDGYIDYSYLSNEDGGGTTVSGTIALTPASFTDLSGILIGIAIDKEVTPTAAIVDSLATVVWGQDESTWPDDYDATAIATAAAAVQDQVVKVHDQ